MRRNITYEVGCIIIIVAINIMAVGGMLFSFTVPTGTRYPLTTVVTEATSEYIICTDFNGNDWEITTNDGDWLVGDFCTMIMNDNGTDLIFDDTIESYRYSGWLDGSWGQPEIISTN